MTWRVFKMFSSFSSYTRDTAFGNINLNTYIYYHIWFSTKSAYEPSTGASLQINISMPSQ